MNFMREHREAFLSAAIRHVIKKLEGEGFTKVGDYELARGHDRVRVVPLGATYTVHEWRDDERCADCGVPLREGAVSIPAGRYYDPYIGGGPAYRRVCERCAREAE